jgi:hypothetical protein
MGKQSCADLIIVLFLALSFLREVYDGSLLKPFDVENVDLKLLSKNKLRCRYSKALIEASVHEPALKGMLVSNSLFVFTFS